MTDAAVPPGWYADADDPARYRFWDGSRWTDRRWPSAEQLVRRESWSRFWHTVRLAAATACAIVALVSVFTQDDWPSGFGVAALLFLLLGAPEKGSAGDAVIVGWAGLWVLGAFVHASWQLGVAFAVVMVLGISVGARHRRRPTRSTAVLGSSLAVAWLALVMVATF